MMFCQKKDINQVLGNPKRARDNELNKIEGRMFNCLSLLELTNVIFSQETSVFGFLILL